MTGRTYVLRLDPGVIRAEVARQARIHGDVPPSGAVVDAVTNLLGVMLDEHRAAVVKELGAASHGWTDHGYPCCGKALVGDRPSGITQCSGPRRCTGCAQQRDQLHAAALVDRTGLLLELHRPITIFDGFRVCKECARVATSTQAHHWPCTTAIALGSMQNEAPAPEPCVHRHPDDAGLPCALCVVDGYQPREAGT